MGMETKKFFIGIILLTFFSIQLQAINPPDEPQVAKFPENATFAENATARFYVNAFSTDNGYLTYQWFRSKEFSTPIKQTGAGGTYSDADKTAIKNGGVKLPEGDKATLTTITPAVTGTKYYYYWVEITNNKGNEKASIEVFAMAKVVDRTLPDHITNGDFSTVYAPNGQNTIYWSNGGTPVNGWYTVAGQSRLPNWKTTDLGGSGNSNVPGFGDIRQSFQLFTVNLKPFGYYAATDKDAVAEPKNPVPVNTDPTTSSTTEPHIVAYTKHGDNGGDTGNFGAIELANGSPSSVYQEIATIPGKIYEWSLDHIRRVNNDDKKDIMAVIIGAAINEQSDLGADANLWENDNIAELHYPYGSSYTREPAESPTYFFKIVNALAKRVIGASAMPSALATRSGEAFTQEYNGYNYYIYIIATGREWTTYPGSYTVPAGQGTTVFGFLAINVQGASGNVLDNISFRSGSPLNTDQDISFTNDVKLSVSTKPNYAYGIVEVRGSSAIHINNPSVHYDADGKGPAGESQISETPSLGYGGWYTGNFNANGIITFKNLTPGKIYRIVGIPVRAVNMGLHTNESPEYVLDEGYYKDVKILPASMGDMLTIGNVDLEVYTEGTDKKLRINVENTRSDVEYALLSGAETTVNTNNPVYSWIPGASGYISFDELNWNSYYYIVARPAGYFEVDYAAAADSAIRMKTPVKTDYGVKIKDIEPNEVTRGVDGKSISLNFFLPNCEYAIVDPETGHIISNIQSGYGVTAPSLIFNNLESKKAYRIAMKSDKYGIMWMKGVHVYPYPDKFTIDYYHEIIKSSANATGNIPVDVEYRIITKGWTKGLGNQPIDLGAATLPGGKSVLDSLETLNLSSVTLEYRIAAERNGYIKKSVSPSNILDIKKRPEPPKESVHYIFNYPDEKITVISDSLHFSQIGTSTWTKVEAPNSWTFVNAGWKESSEKAFHVRIPATNNSFASSPNKTDTIPRRPDAPIVELKYDNGNLYLIGLNKGDTLYHYYKNSEPQWIDIPVNVGTYKLNNFTASDTCNVRLKATATAPASFISPVAMPLTVYPLSFSYDYAAVPVEKNLTIINFITNTIDIDSVKLENNANFILLPPPTLLDSVILGNATNTSWKIIPKSGLDAGSYQTKLTVYCHVSYISYIAFADIYLDVKKIDWDMRAISGSFVESLTEAHKLVLNISNAPVGAVLKYYFGLTSAPGNPEDLVPSGGAITHPFENLNPQSGYEIRVKALGDKNHFESQLIILGTGYTAYDIPNFWNMFEIDYFAEQLIFKTGYSSNNYTLTYKGDTVKSPYLLTNILDTLPANAKQFTLSLVRNGNISPPYPASAATTGNIPARPDAPTGVSVTHASGLQTGDGKITLAGQFEYRAHGSLGAWLFATNEKTLGSGQYDVRKYATSTSFASKPVLVTISTIAVQPQSINVVKCCIDDTVSVIIPPTSNIVTYQWYRCNAPDKSGSAAISGATAEHFPIPITLDVGKYYYYCTIKIENSGSLVSSVATVTVTALNLPNKIKSIYPNNICLGENIELEFNGHPPFGVYYTVDNGTTGSFVVTGGYDTTIVANVIGKYTFRNMLNGKKCSSCAGEFHIEVHPKVKSGVIGNDQTICYNTVPAQLRSTPASGGSSGNYSYRWIRSDDNGQSWLNTDSTLNTFTPPTLTATTMFRLITEAGTNLCGKDTSNIVTITLRARQLNDYPDIRIHVCPNVGTFNLSKYLDTIDVESIHWTGSIPISNPVAGVISSDDFGNSNDLTFTYTIKNTCLGSNISRKVYLNILNRSKMPSLQNTITICYKQAEAININQIFGIETGGTMTWSSNANGYITKSTSPTHHGAVVMNGKALYEKGVKEVEFVYDTGTGSGNCFGGKKFLLTIKLIEN
jgi:hypothetical protein